MPKYILLEKFALQIRIQKYLLISRSIADEIGIVEMSNFEMSNVNVKIYRDRNFKFLIHVIQFIFLMVRMDSKSDPSFRQIRMAKATVSVTAEGQFLAHWARP